MGELQFYLRQKLYNKHETRQKPIILFESETAFFFLSVYDEQINKTKKVQWSNLQGGTAKVLRLAVIEPKRDATVLLFEYRYSY